MRNIWKFKWLNDGFRTLYESVVYPEVLQTLSDWKIYSNTLDNSVLIGGLALSFYLKPRPTEDIDLIFLSKDDVPKYVNGFTRPREHAFRHIKTHVEVEVLDPQFLGKSVEFMQTVFDESIISNGIRVASPRSLIALKLGRFSVVDRSDIVNLIKYCKSNDTSIDFTNYNLSDSEIEKLNISLKESLNECHQNMHMLECYSLVNNSNYEVLRLRSDEYDIFVTNEKYYDSPSFYYGKNIGKSRIIKHDDFSFLVKIPNDVNEKLEVIYSSTDYKSFTGRRNEEIILNDWLKNNLDYLKESWYKLNKKRD